MSHAPSRFAHTAIRASAGSGKTHRLTSRFIALLAANETPDRVLATTFTRKAAGEILERILQRLAAAARDPARCQALAADIGDPTLTPARACELVGRLARDLHRLHARTLDSFFARIARSFALELDLPPEWQINDEAADATLRAEAIQAVLRDNEPRLLTELVRHVSIGDASRSVAARIQNEVTKLHALFGDTDRAAWERIPHPPHQTPEEIDRAIARLAELPMPTNKNREPNTPWTKARDGNVQSAREANWDSFIEKGIASAIHSAKATFSKLEIHSDARAAYGPLLAQAKAVLVGRVADRCRASYRLLEEFDARYRRLQRGERTLRFEDVTRALAHGAAAERLQDVYFRLDADVHHLLLDEFQDTSLEQWEVLRPIAEEVISHRDQTHSFFSVGDVKQAIYGWRGGVAEIFGTLEGDFPDLKWEPLNESRRSSPVIIDVVNRLFGGLAGNAALDKHRDAASAWCEQFEEHETVHKKKPGHARLVVAPRAAECEKQDERTLAFAAAEIARIASEAPGKSIGVLVRKNKATARLIYELRERRVHASEEGGNPLTDTPAVTVLLSLLKLADHPGDTAARFHVASSPLGPVVGLARQDDEPAARRVAAAVRRSLVRDGYGPTVWDWVARLEQAGACDARELGRLGQLVELAHRYEATASLRPADFVRFVEATPVEDPVPADVRVMSIHKAKGLQFDIVVLPDLDGKLISRPPPVVTHRPSPTARIDCVCPYVSETIRALLPADLQKLFVESENQAVRGELCVLYVALTRAASAMHLIVAPDKVKAAITGDAAGLPTTFAGILRAALGDGERLEPGAIAFEHGDAAWHKGEQPPSGAAVDTSPKRERGKPTEDPSLARRAIIEAAVRGAEPSMPARPLVSAATGHAVRGLARETPSSLEGGERVDLRKRLKLGIADALDRGSVFHAWFELIEWLDDGAPSDDALRAAAQRTGVRGDRLDEQMVEFRRMLGQPAICAALSRPAAAAAKRFEVWRERPFVVRTGDTLLTGKFDRVVLTLDGARVTRADVLDFKADAVAAENAGHIESLVEHYRPQLEAYQNAVARLTGVAAARIAARLVFVTIGAVREL